MRQICHMDIWPLLTSADTSYIRDLAVYIKHFELLPICVVCPHDNLHLYTETKNEEKPVVGFSHYVAY